MDTVTPEQISSSQESLAPASQAPGLQVLQTQPVSPLPSQAQQIPPALQKVLEWLRDPRVIATLTVGALVVLLIGVYRLGVENGRRDADLERMLRK